MIYEPCALEYRVVFYGYLADASEVILRSGQMDIEREHSAWSGAARGPIVRCLRPLAIAACRRCSGATHSAAIADCHSHCFLSDIGAPAVEFNGWQTVSGVKVA